VLLLIPVSLTTWAIFILFAPKSADKLHLTNRDHHFHSQETQKNIDECSRWSYYVSLEAH
jgi:hypothetical protein